MTRMTRKDEQEIKKLIEAAHADMAPWPVAAIREIIQECMDSERDQYQQWIEYARDRQLTLALYGDGAWVRLTDYQEMEGLAIRERKNANTQGWLLIALGLIVVGLVVMR